MPTLADAVVNCLLIVGLLSSTPGSLRVVLGSVLACWKSLHLQHDKVYDMWFIAFRLVYISFSFHLCWVVFNSVIFLPKTFAWSAPLTWRLCAQAIFVTEDKPFQWMGEVIPRCFQRNLSTNIQDLNIFAVLLYLRAPQTALFFFPLYKPHMEEVHTYLFICYASDCYPIEKRQEKPFPNMLLCILICKELEFLLYDFNPF